MDIWGYGDKRVWRYGDIGIWGLTPYNNSPL